MAKSWNDHHNPWGASCRRGVRSLNRRYRQDVKRLLKTIAV
jgi:hypothetical protein